MIAILLIAAVANLDEPAWTLQQSGTTARLRGVCAVDAKVAWAAGNQGTILRTIDGGEHWRTCAPAETSTLDFRDIEAFDAETAWALAIGPGEASRIYKTSDGGRHWSLVHLNRDARVFLDAIAFWDDQHGIAMGDPVEGRFTILVTSDGGEHWQVPEDLRIPAVLPNEGAFAASGTCLAVHGQRSAWFASGGAVKARVFRSTDRGRTWTVAETDVRTGKSSAGIFSIAFRDAEHGLAVGGDYQATDETGPVVAHTSDGGLTWTTEPQAGVGGLRSCVVFTCASSSKAGLALAVGPNGTDRSADGVVWSRGAKEGFHAADASPDGTVAWAVGEAGRIGRVEFNGGTK